MRTAVMLVALISMSFTGVAEAASVHSNPLRWFGWGYGPGYHATSRRNCPHCNCHCQPTPAPTPAYWSAAKQSPHPLNLSAHPWEDVPVDEEER